MKTYKTKVKWSVGRIHTFIISMKLFEESFFTFEYPVSDIYGVSCSCRTHSCVDMLMLKVYTEIGLYANSS